MGSGAGAEPALSNRNVELGTGEPRLWIDHSYNPGTMAHNTRDLLLSERFPRSSVYNPEWVIANASGGANSLWLTEWLAQGLELTPGLRVLDLGCGRAASSIFLQREFGVNVWATDLWFSASEKPIVSVPTQYAKRPLLRGSS